MVQPDLTDTCYFCCLLDNLQRQKNLAGMRRCNKIWLHFLKGYRLFLSSLIISYLS